MNDNEFTDRDWTAMLHPEGGPGQLALIYGDRGAKAAIDQTVASARLYESLASKAQSIAAATVTLALLALLFAVPALVWFWRVALG